VRIVSVNECTFIISVQRDSVGIIYSFNTEQNNSVMHSSVGLSAKLPDTNLRVGI